MADARDDLKEQELSRASIVSLADDVAKATLPGALDEVVAKVEEAAVVKAEEAAVAKVEEVVAKVEEVVVKAEAEVGAGKAVPVEPLAKLMGFDQRLVTMFFDLVKAESAATALNAATLLDVVRMAMELVEAQAVLSGAEKKRLVIHVVRSIVERTEFESAEAKRLCLSLFDTGVVSAAIDLAAVASKGHLAINIPVLNRKGCACVVS